MDSTTRARFLELLTQVSRSFVVGIQALDDSLQDDVMLGYLLCRIFDTYEDTMTVSSEFRGRLLDLAVEDFDRLTVKQSHSAHLGLEEWNHRHQFESSQWDQLKVRHLAEFELLKLGYLVWNEIIDRPKEIRLCFESSLKEMAQGMKSEVYQRQTLKVGLARSLKEANHYCYLVAGTVGLFLTRRFLIEDAFKKKANVELEVLAVEFGKTLQWVNIAKDFHKDWVEGRVYWPGIPAPQLGLKASVEGGLLKGAFGVLKSEFDRGYQSALLYIDQIVEDRQDIRFFCLFPLLAAQATMEVGTRDLAWLESGGTFKIDRAKVHEILSMIETPNLR
jgi:farnesyl-diphosphate farnesyltransferase